MCLAVIISFFNYLHQQVQPTLKAIANNQVHSALGKIANEVIASLDYDSYALYHINYNEDKDINTVDFDTKAINDLLAKALVALDNSFLALQQGFLDPNTNICYYEQGIIYRYPILDILGVPFLYDKGFKLNIRLRMLSDVNGDIVYDIKPYGSNAALIKIDLKINIQAEIVTYLGKSLLDDEMYLPIVMQVVHGKVSDYKR